MVCFVASTMVLFTWSPPKCGSSHHRSSSFSRTLLRQQRAEQPMDFKICLYWNAVYHLTMEIWCQLTVGKQDGESCLLSTSCLLPAAEHPLPPASKGPISTLSTKLSLQYSELHSITSPVLASASHYTPAGPDTLLWLSAPRKILWYVVDRDQCLSANLKPKRGFPLSPLSLEM